MTRPDNGTVGIRRRISSRVNSFFDTCIPFFGDGYTVPRHSFYDRAIYKAVDSLHAPVSVFRYLLFAFIHGQIDAIIFIRNIMVLCRRT